ncbi:hypothetical protein E2C01_023514 [Portunus trituberculatus]|uniref:Uncharacterized protein n=1 Tax=Portunus trituberculatus TaxID=210409 RepID=A0A5B7EBB6_PORTR|nr:hypothetical protein [Portunus trituberculatus]
MEGKFCTRHRYQNKYHYRQKLLAQQHLASHGSLKYEQGDGWEACVSINYPTMAACVVLLAGIVTEGSVDHFNQLQHAVAVHEKLGRIVGPRLPRLSQEGEWTRKVTC